jgi:histidine ammonia-lyase
MPLPGEARMPSCMGFWTSNPYALPAKGAGMTVVLSKRTDINLANFRRVAWQREAVQLSDSAMKSIADCRASFLQLIDRDPNLVIYGVTTAMGELASHRLSDAERERHARLKPFAAATSFGDPLPERVVRGIVLARLANFVEGHAATSLRIAEAVTAMLDGGAMPIVPGSGQGGAGEILALYPLFAALSERFELEVKERGSLINGSPCAAALVADAALAARRRLDLAHQVFALSIEAFRAPLEHYDAALDSLWNDGHEAAALRGLRHFLEGAGDGRRNYQAPVSYRILPRVLGQAHRAAIGRVSHLPDLLLVGRDPSDADGHGNIGYVPMAITGYLEQAKAAAQRTFIPGSESAGAGQDDVASPVFLAFAKEATAGRCLDTALAMLAVMASQALHVTNRQAPPALRDFVGGLRAIVAPVTADRVLGPELGRLAEVFTARVFESAA